MKQLGGGIKVREKSLSFETAIISHLAILSGLSRGIKTRRGGEHLFYNNLTTHKQTKKQIKKKLAKENIKTNEENRSSKQVN